MQRRPSSRGPASQSSLCSRLLFCQWRSTKYAYHRAAVCACLRVLRGCQCFFYFASSHPLGTLAIFPTFVNRLLSSFATSFSLALSSPVAFLSSPTVTRSFSLVSPAPQLSFSLACAFVCACVLRSCTSIFFWVLLDSSRGDCTAVRTRTRIPRCLAIHRTLTLRMHSGAHSPYRRRKMRRRKSCSPVRWTSQKR